MEQHQYQALPEVQRTALEDLAKRYNVPTPEPGALELDPPDQPPGFLCGWVGPIFCGISPEGQVHS